MDSNEIKNAANAAVAEARGFRRWLANFADRHPNTAAGYIIATFPLALIGLFVVIGWFRG